MKIYSELNNMTYSIIRDKTKQFETEKETGREAEWEIIWLNDCEYKLILLKDNSGILTSGQFKTAPSFIYKIISTTSDYYIFETRIPPAMQLITDTIFLVK